MEGRSLASNQTGRPADDRPARNWEAWASVAILLVAPAAAVGFFYLLAGGGY